MLHLIAHHCDLEPCDFVYFIGNAHIYDDHMSQLKEQTTNELYEFPTLSIKNKHDKLEDYTLEDFELINYTHHPSISMKMRV